jgi:hypothetical protein
MNRLPADPWHNELEELLNKERYLEQEIRGEERRLSGLRDIEKILELVNLKLKVALHLLEGLETGRVSFAGLDLQAQGSRRATEAAQMIDDLMTLDLSPDQAELIKEEQGYREARESLEDLLLRGGAVLFQPAAGDEKKVRQISRAILDSLIRFQPRDDLYPPPQLDHLPDLIRRLVLFFFPILAPSGQKMPPYGIEEGEEVVYSARKMKMPLPQAIHYLETELLPNLEEQVSNDPGNGALQREILAIQEKIARYREMRFTPRSTPILPEKGFYDEWFTGYSADGEMLVDMPLEVHYRSGTNLERKMEQVRAAVTKGLCGKGICTALDGEYGYLKSLESGIHGSSRLPSFKVNLKRGFHQLKRLYPLLGCLEDKTQFQRLEALARSVGKRRAQRWLENRLTRGKTTLELPEEPPY